MNEDEIIRQALNKAALLVENDAKMLCPVDMGTLRRSITHEVDVANAEATVGTNQEYAPYVEFGTGIFAADGNGRKERWCYQRADGEWVSTLGNPPQPFLNPALQKNQAQVLDIFTEAVKEIINAGLQSGN